MGKRMARVILLRHGQSTENENGRIAGKGDCGLSFLGQNQCRAAARLLEQFAIQKIYCSTLPRATQTAEIIRQELALQAVPVLYDCALDARHYGQLQGRSQNEIIVELGRKELDRLVAAGRLPARLLGRPFHEQVLELGEKKFKEIKRSVHLTPPDGESFSSIQNRTSFLYRQYLYCVDIISNHADIVSKDAVLSGHAGIPSNRAVLVVSHGNVLSAMVQKFKKLDEEQLLNIFPKHGIPYVFEFDVSFKSGRRSLFQTSRRLIARILHKPIKSAPLGIQLVNDYAIEPDGKQVPHPFDQPAAKIYQLFETPAYVDLPPSLLAGTRESVG